jgi:alkanesulfonate monooxygenase SsuD/methylene tetrahydromethanopterin reductase-like flavin-dependent oxidoreductase (luciferase family)
VLISLCLDSRRPWAETRALARRAEDAGLARLYVPDHFMPYHASIAVAGPVHESWTTLSALGVATTTIGLGTLVLGNSYRHPAVVANMAATLDQLSNGRLLLGLGAGSQPNEHAAYGIELLRPADRISRFEEALQVITSLLRSEMSTFHGSYYRLDAARCEPATVQRPLPLLVAGAGEHRSIPLAARFADAWHAWTTAEQFQHKSELLDAACTAAGRAPTEIRRLTGQVLRVLARAGAVDDDDDIIGSAPFVSERLAAYRDAGVDEFIVRDHAHTPIESAIESVNMLATDVLPSLSTR